MIDTACMPSGSGNGAIVVTTFSFSAAPATSATRSARGRVLWSSAKIVPINTCDVAGEKSMYVLRWQLESADSCVSVYTEKLLGPPAPIGMTLTRESGHFASDREAKFVSAASREGALCADAQRGRRATAVARRDRFMIAFLGPIESHCALTVR